MRAEPDLLDGVEVLPTSIRVRKGSRTSFAAKFAREVGGVDQASGSDFHHPGTAGMGGIYTAALPAAAQSSSLSSAPAITCSISSGPSPRSRDSCKTGTRGRGERGEGNAARSTRRGVRGEEYAAF